LPGIPSLGAQAASLDQKWTKWAICSVRSADALALLALGDALADFLGMQF
jgi:hypothetical protein